MLKAIIDFDGALTAEKTQAAPLAERSLDALAAAHPPGCVLDDLADLPAALDAL